MQTSSTCWVVLLLLLGLGQANCTVQLQPITRLAGWEASGTWVLNAARIIAAGSAMDKNQIHVLQLQRGTWLLADVISPEPGAHFIPGSVQLSDDGRLLAVAAVATQASSARHAEQQQEQSQEQEQLTVGYVFKVVAQPNSQHAFTYQLAARLSVPGVTATLSPNNKPPTTSGSTDVTPQLHMTADGHTILACWAVTAGSQPASQPVGSITGGASVFSWRAFGQSLQAVHLTLPAGSKSFGHSCRLSADGRVALVTDAARGAMVYQREVHTPRGSAVSAAAAYRAAGWLAGAPARERYQVVAADLGPSGRQAVLLVQGVRPSTWSSSGSSYAALKVFAGEPLGEWTAVCSIDLNTTASTTTSMTLQTGGDVQVSDFPGGVHVWAAHNGTRMMYDVGLQGLRLSYCPTRPVLTAQHSLTTPLNGVRAATTPGLLSDPAAAAAAAATAAAPAARAAIKRASSPSLPAAVRCVRTGVLTVSNNGSQIVYNAGGVASE